MKHLNEVNSWSEHKYKPVPCEKWLSLAYRQVKGGNISSGLFGCGTGQTYHFMDANVNLGTQFEYSLLFCMYYYEIVALLAVSQFQICLRDPQNPLRIEHKADFANFSCFLL